MYKKIIFIVLVVVVCGCKKEEVTSEKTRFLLGFWQVQRIAADSVTVEDTYYLKKTYTIQ